MCFEPTTNTRVLSLCGYLLLKLSPAFLDLVIEVDEHDDVSVRVIRVALGCIHPETS